MKVKEILSRIENNELMIPLFKAAGIQVYYKKKNDYYVFYHEDYSGFYSNELSISFNDLYKNYTVIYNNSNCLYRTIVNRLLCKKYIELEFLQGLYLKGTKENVCNCIKNGGTISYE